MSIGASYFIQVRQTISHLYNRIILNSMNYLEINENTIFANTEEPITEQPKLSFPFFFQGKDPILDGAVRCASYDIVYVIIPCSFPTTTKK